MTGLLCKIAGSPRISPMIRSGGLGNLLPRGRCHHGQDSAGDGAGQQWWHGVTHLFILLAPWTKKSEIIPERLEPRGLTDSDRPILRWVDISTPMQVAFGQDCARLAVRVHAAIAFCVIAPACQLHSGREQRVRKVAPTPALRDVLHSISVDRSQARLHMVICSFRVCPQG